MARRLRAPPWIWSAYVELPPGCAVEARTFGPRLFSCAPMGVEGPLARTDCAEWPLGRVGWKTKPPKPKTSFKKLAASFCVGVLGAL